MKRVNSLFVSLLLAAGSASGQTTVAPSHGPDFECWVGKDGPPYYAHYIRCIVDRDDALAPQDGDRQGAMMDALHRELHNGTGAAVEKKFSENIESIKEVGGVWNIRIHSYPADWSWNDGMPERLVRSVLCPKDQVCSVVVRKY